MRWLDKSTWKKNISQKEKQNKSNHLLCVCVCVPVCYRRYPICWVEKSCSIIVFLLKASFTLIQLSLSRSFSVAFLLAVASPVFCFSRLVIQSDEMPSCNLQSASTAQLTSTGGSSILFWNANGEKNILEQKQARKK